MILSYRKYHQCYVFISEMGIVWRSANEYSLDHENSFVKPAFRNLLAASKREVLSNNVSSGGEDATKKKKFRFESAIENSLNLA